MKLDLDTTIGIAYQRMQDTSLPEDERNMYLSDYVMLMKYQLLYKSGDIIGEAMTRHDPRMVELDQIFQKETR